MIKQTVPMQAEAGAYITGTNQGGKYELALHGNISNHIYLHCLLLF